MFFKAIFVAVLAVGALAEYQLTEDQQNSFKHAVTEYCKKNGAEDKATQVQDSAKTFVDCIKNLFDPETIKQEIEAAKPNGALDEVFGKYCAKAPQLKTCINTLLTNITPCLEDKVKEHMGSITNGSDQLIDFVCYKDGDRIALFIAEGGPECFKEKKTAIQACGELLKQQVPNLEAAKGMSLTEQCTKFDELTTCIVKALEGCRTPTPSNMAESLFKYVRKSSPCQTALPKN